MDTGDALSSTSPAIRAWLAVLHPADRRAIDGAAPASAPALAGACVGGVALLAPCHGAFSLATATALVRWRAE